MGIKVFKTNEEAMLYAKNNPGTVITRSSDGKGYTVKNNKPKKIKVDTSNQDLRALLLDTKSELNYICSCILQTDKKTAYNITNKAGEVLASKLAGLGVSGGRVKKLLIIRLACKNGSLFIKHRLNFIYYIQNI